VRSTRLVMLLAGVVAAAVAGCSSAQVARHRRAAATACQRDTADRRSGAL